MTQKFMNKLKASPDSRPLAAMLLFLAFQEEDVKTLAYIKVFPIHSHFCLTLREMCPCGGLFVGLCSSTAPRGPGWKQDPAMEMMDVHWFPSWALLLAHAPPLHPCPKV